MAAVPAETEPPARSTARKTTAIDGDLLRDLRILVVDDEPDARDLIEMALSQYGAIVTTVDSAAAALSEIDRRLPDVLLSDVGMPREDGYELIGRVRSRRLQPGGGIPAIAVTANASASEPEPSLCAGYMPH